MFRLEQGLCVEQCPEGEQRIEGDFRLGCFAQAVADRWLKHPTRYGQASLILDLYDERFIVLASKTPNDVDALAIVGVISVVDLMGVGFMSSVMIPVVIPGPHTCLNAV